MDPVIPLVITPALAILWLVAGTQKLRAFGEFSAVLADYRLVPDKTTDLCAAAVIALELGHGIALLLPVVRHVALIGSAALLILYAAAMAANLVRGRRFIDCGCMGPAARQPLSGWLVSRNLLLALVALGGILPTRERALVLLDAFSIAAALGVAILLYAAINHLIVNAPDLARLRS